MLTEMLSALLLTILVEAAAAIALGYRTRRKLSATVLINCLTNVPFNFSLWMIYLYRLFPLSLGFILLCELVIVLVEWRLLGRLNVEKGRKGLLLSFIMNASSFFAGLVIL